MKRSDIKLLLVEDDQSIGKALNEGLARAGYSLRWVQTPEEAVSLFKISSFQGVIIDCMLPKKNGVDLALELREMGGEDFKLIFTSGIFKDKGFTQNAVNQTKATAFLAKPFDISKLKDVVDACFSELFEEDKRPLFQLFLQESVSFKELKLALQKEETLHGLDLPCVYSLLSHTKFSGRAHILSSGKDPSTVTFSQGRVTDVALKDAESYFGILLVEMGFTSTEEVENSLLSITPKPIGQKLVDADALSPHAVKIVRAEQLTLRLSKTIQNTPIELRLSEEDIPRQDVEISEAQFSQLMHDWCSSKIGKDWLSQFYLQWIDHPLSITSNAVKLNRIKNSPHFKAHLNGVKLIEEVNGKNNLQALVNAAPGKELERLKIVFYGLLERIFYFSPKAKASSDFRSLAQRLNLMAQDLEKKNHFEILGLTPRARSKEISKAYLDLAKSFHPDKIDPQAPQSLKHLSQKVFARVTQAHDALKDSEKRAAYQKELEFGNASQALAEEQQLEKGIQALAVGQYKLALSTLSPLLEAKHNLGSIRIHYAWAALKAQNDTPPGLIKEIHQLLLEVPPEDRHCASFFYVKGLFLKANGDNERAHTQFRNALAVDPNMADAKRELLVLQRRSQEAKQASGDWGKKISKFFKR